MLGYLAINFGFSALRTEWIGGKWSSNRISTTLSRDKTPTPEFAGLLSPTGSVR
jgi:hypothetical protein